jgi:protein-tyrosine phosphatase
VQDRQRLVNDYKIKTIIDLRTKTEHIEEAKKRDAKVQSSEAIPQSNDQVAEPLKIPGIAYREINFNGSAFSKMLISKLSWREFFRLVGLMAAGYRLDAIKVLSPHMEEMGLVGLATNSLDVCTREVKQFFEVLVDEANWPLLVHCTQGKDRTGLTVMLVLLLLGVDFEAVGEDYILSESELQAEMQARIEEISTIGLSERFARIDPNMLQAVHHHLEKYGGIEEYLISVGVNKQMQDRVKQILLEDDK